jgi:predicted acyltransferase
MQLMILVDDAGGVLPAINHSPWNGLTLADVVMPFFLFIVGVSLGLTYKVSAIGKFIVSFKHLQHTTHAMITITSAVIFI